MRELAAGLAQALEMLFSLTVNERTQLPPETELFTSLAISNARRWLSEAVVAGLLIDKSEEPSK